MVIGFSLLKNGKVIKLEKGMKLDVRDIAKTIKNANYDWALFHTRLASVGEKSDSNCHPFRKGDTIIAMNGTEKSVSFVSDVKDITDTEAILDIMEKYNLGLTALKKLSSIFVGFQKGKPFVVADNTYNIKVLYNKKNNAICFASTFPTKFRKNIFQPKECFTWFNGEMPKCLVKAKKFKVKNLVKKETYDEYYDSIEDFYNEYYGIKDVESMHGQCYLDEFEKAS